MSEKMEQDLLEAFRQHRSPAAARADANWETLESTPVRPNDAAPAPPSSGAVATVIGGLAVVAMIWATWPTQEPEAAARTAAPVVAEAPTASPRVDEPADAAEARWPVHLVAAPLGALAPQLAFDDHPVARHLRELRASERAYEAALGTHDVNAIAVRPGFKDAAEKTGDTLVVRPDQPFTIYVRYRRPYHQLSVELWMHGERHVGVPVTMEPGWNRNRIEVGVGNRPATEGVMTIKVLGPDGELVASRDLWQHP